MTTINSTHGADRAVAMKADAGSVAETKQLVTDIVAKYQKLDIVVCNAGKIYGSTGLENTAEEEFDEAFRVNVKGVYFLVQVSTFRSLELSSALSVFVDYSILTHLYLDLLFAGCSTSYPLWWPCYPLLVIPRRFLYGPTFLPPLHLHERRH